MVAAKDREPTSETGVPAPGLTFCQDPRAKLCTCQVLTPLGNTLWAPSRQPKYTLGDYMWETRSSLSTEHLSPAYTGG